MTGDHPSSAEPSEPEDRTISTPVLLAGARRRLRANPRTTLAVLAAGLVVTAVDLVRSQDPVPTLEYAGVQTGNVEVLSGPLVSVTSRTGVDPVALQGLKPGWLAWTVGLELLELFAIVGAVTYAVGEMLDHRPTSGATLRYAGVLALVAWGSTVPDLQVDVGLLLGIPLLLFAALVIVGLFAVPGLIVTGHTLPRAVSRSWRLCYGHAGGLFGVVLVLAVGNHLLTSVPVVGAVGSAAVAAVHAGTVTTFLDRTTPRAAGSPTSRARQPTHSTSQ